MIQKSSSAATSTKSWEKIVFWGNWDICWLKTRCQLKLSPIIIVISTNSPLPVDCKATRPDHAENLALFCKWILRFEQRAQSGCESHTNISIPCVNRGQPLAEITPIFAILAFVENCAKPVILYTYRVFLWSWTKSFFPCWMFPSKKATCASTVNFSLKMFNNIAWWKFFYRSFSKIGDSFSNLVKFGEMYMTRSWFDINVATS